MTIGAHGLDVELAASLHHQIAAPAFADIGAWRWCGLLCTGYADVAGKNQGRQAKQVDGEFHG